jgi:ABC-2 type transport system permease protein
MEPSPEHILKSSIGNIWRLGIKELFSLRYDAVLMFLIIYSFTYAIYVPAKNAAFGMVNASVGIVDEDDSALSRRLKDALQLPYFLPPESLTVAAIDRAMDTGERTFVLDIGPRFEADVKAGRQPTLQVLVDATAMTQAGTGAAYLEQIIARELAAFEPGAPHREPVALVTRAKFNPNLESSWFMAVMETVNNITMLALFLSGAAIIREREHGTIEHLLAMPLRPVEVMLAKVWANGLVIVAASMLSLHFVVHLLLGVPIAGSLLLFGAGLVCYLFSVMALGILLGTLARSMPQFALLAMPVFIIMNLLSGGTTPQESMPFALRAAMQLSPSTHFVNFAAAILYRGAGIDVVWPDFLASALIGMLFFGAALWRFRRALAL